MELAILEAVYFLNSDSSKFFKLVIRGNNCTCRQSNTLRQDFILFIDIVCVQVNLQTLIDNVSTPTSYATFYGLNYFSQTVILLARHAFVPVRSGELRDEPKESSEIFLKKNRN